VARQVSYKTSVARSSARGALTLAVFALALGGCAATNASLSPEDEAVGPIIDELELVGVKQVDSGDLKKHILTSASFLEGLPWVGETQRFDPNTWQADLRRVERYYQARGFYQARVEGDEVIPTGKDNVKLRVRIDEGAPTLLSELRVEGLDALPADLREKVLAKLPLALGKVFLEEHWLEEKAQLAQRLREGGYAEAAVTGEVQVDLATRTAKVRLVAAPGVRYRFGKVVVATDANAQVAAARIIERVSGAATPGDWYNEAALAEAQARVFQFGVFSAVKVNRGAPDREEGTVPIVVDVREAPFHSRRIGVGLGIEQTRQEARVTGEYTDRNFFGGLRRYTLRGKVGYAFLPDVLAVANGSASSKSGVIADLTNEFEQPWLLGPDVSLQASLELKSGLEPAYNFQGGGVRLGVPWRPRRDLTVFPSYNFDLYFLSGPALLGGQSPAVTFGCPSPCIVSYLEQTIEYDRRDDRTEPRSGYYLALSLQEGGGPLQGAFTYLKIQPDVRGYVSFGEDRLTTVAARLKLGTLLAQGGQSPIVSRFFSGGAQMRGFNTRRLSPLMAVANAEDGLAATTGLRPGATLPVGGDGLFEASVELRQRVFGDFVVAVFADSGFVTSSSLSFTSLDYYARNLLLAAGFGLRYLTAFGPIRLDLAHRLPLGPPLPVGMPANGGVDYPTYGSCFGLGSAPAGYAGSPEGLCSFHLSIGEAF
jgi:translocation and assembly module TamA